MREPSRAFLLGPLLKGVSRSFYLTLRVLPERMRDPVGLAYLLARAADTIADTSLIPPQRRLALLLSLRDQVNGATADTALADSIATEVAGRQEQQSDERILLESLGPALAVLAQLEPDDRQAVRQIVSTLSEGMEFDLRTFPDENAGRIVALREPEELDRYTYLVAGCVGEFWTSMTAAHMPGAIGKPDAMLRRGVRFGKALQMTNVLRDCGKDLRIGRCYLPATMLHQHGLSPQDLLLADASPRARALMLELVRKTLDHFCEAMTYTLAIHPRFIRLRLACLWPVLIGMETLLLLVRNDDWLDPAKASRLQRGKVYRIIAYSLPMVLSNSLLRIWFARQMRNIDAVIRGFNGR
ncbi:Phytoene/squalene synthetase [Cupriavidus necator]|uniref:Farnesyl-diphosphate farnesyltransferase n=1 Tax=Cupriavidus necator (strain ATCC 17699 / DSM 428 / KCTC 22496 / NCIMB 10442 / H16 / Stanier 337) TaxID=381666 RepID=Q0K4R5_CUPNH|nr:phytoene/squalene synthase family protein [Cupriavidus necator]QCC02945.1 squalene/phytoene synthase family protein [Cupriavidus necator H16]QQB79999.1 squalene/phytoene synthase family protein [Cupriavidus necator]WKA44254.1 phytoene/squalene synthase family protein [Cupriavidus necator]CAJ95009.1 Farnesyl-diphosphate farnesyltransferase [Cupriavidus necator H16]